MLNPMVRAHFLYAVSFAPYIRRSRSVSYCYTTFHPFLLSQTAKGANYKPPPAVSQGVKSQDVEGAEAPFTLSRETNIHSRECRHRSPPVSSPIHRPGVALIYGFFWYTSSLPFQARHADPFHHIPLEDKEDDEHRDQGNDGHREHRPPVRNGFIA